MNFSIAKKKYIDYLIFASDFANVIKFIDASLNYWSDLPIEKDKRYGFYLIKKTKAEKNKNFYKFLVKLQKDFNFPFLNSNNDQWITNFIQELYKYKNILDKQWHFFQQIINKKTVANQLNSSFFRSTFIPKTFQKAYAHLSLQNGRFANFSSPGSGKTVISYMNAFSLFSDQKIDLLIVVGPKSAQYAWFEEWKLISFDKIFHADDAFNFANKPLKYINHFIHKNFFEKTKLYLIFVNFHKLQNSLFFQKFFKLFKDYKKMLVIDEAHYIKNPKNDLHLNICQLSSQSEYVQLLTGTPLPRFSQEGFYIINTLFPDIVEETVFKKQAFKEANIKTVLGGWKNSQSRQELQAKLKLFFVRKTKQDLITDGFLKQMQEITLKINIERTEEILIKSYQKHQLFLSSQNLFDKKNISLLIRRMQASSYPPLLWESWSKVIDDLVRDVFDDFKKETIETQLRDDADCGQKINNILKQILKEPKMQKIQIQYQKGELIPHRWKEVKKLLQTKNKQKILIWDVFRASMSALQKYLRKIFPNRSIFLINGETPTKKRLTIISNFKQSANGILIASPATIAESVSFHREVDLAIYLYKNFVGSHFMQSKDRIHRLVGKNEVQNQKILYFIEASSPSIDYHIAKNLKDKEKDQESFLD